MEISMYVLKYSLKFIEIKKISVSPKKGPNKLLNSRTFYVYNGIKSLNS